MARFRIDERGEFIGGAADGYVATGVDQQALRLCATIVYLTRIPQSVNLVINGVRVNVVLEPKGWQDERREGDEGEHGVPDGGG